MTWLILSLLVIGRIAAASSANVLQKRAISSPLPLGTAPTALELLVATWTWMVIALAPWWLAAIAGTVLLLTGATVTPSTIWFQLAAAGPNTNVAFWGWIAVACILEVPGNFLLLRSIQSTDLSIFGPLNSYKPVLGMFLGWWILAEIPSLMGLAGMGIVLTGSVLLSGRAQAADLFESRSEKEADLGWRGSKDNESDSPPKSQPPSGRGSQARKRYFLGTENRGVRDRLVAVALTAAGSIFLKLGMHNVNPLTALAAWSLISWLFAAIWLLMQLVFERPSTFGRTFSLTFQRDVILVACSMLLMQATTIILFQRMAVGYALALFQLGSLLSVYLGYRLFGEADFIRRMIAAAIMVLGATFIMLAG